MSSECHSSLSLGQERGITQQEGRKSVISVEETENLATDVLGTSLVVVHDALVGGEDDDAELTGGEDSVGEVLELLEGEVETGRDDTALVKTAVQVDDDLAIAGVVDDLELVDVAVSLHDLEELDEHLGDGAQDHLKYKSASVSHSPQS